MSPKIKVIQVIADSGLGGAPTHVLGLLRNLDRKFFDCYLICPPGHLATEAKKIADTTVVRLVFGSKFDLFAWSDLRRIIQKIQVNGDPFGPMIIHSHGPRAGLAAGIFKIAGARSIYTEHVYGEGYHLKNRINEWLQKRTLSWLNRRNAAVIAVSESVKDFLIKAKMAKPDRVIVIPNGIEISDKAKQNKPVGAAPVIGTIGNLYFLKGHKFLVEAMGLIVKKYPLVKLEIVGEGPARGYLEKMIRDLGLDRNITLLGAKKEASQYLAKWDVFVLPSLAETFGITILEAFAAGVPVVATKAGGIPDIINDKENGLLVSVKSARALASAIDQILADQHLAKNLVAGGHARLKDFTWNKIIQKVEAVYQRVVQ